jgi:hypothetical protein
MEKNLVTNFDAAYEGLRINNFSQLFLIAFLAPKQRDPVYK